MKHSAAGPGRTSGAGDGGLTLPRDLRDWARVCPDAWEEYVERAAILQHEARMVQSRAEAAAEDIVRQRWSKRR